MSRTLGVLVTPLAGEAAAALAHSRSEADDGWAPPRWQRPNRTSSLRKARSRPQDSWRRDAARAAFGSMTASLPSSHPPAGHSTRPVDHEMALKGHIALQGRS
jgi:hypothetical protein